MPQIYHSDFLNDEAVIKNCETLAKSSFRRLLGYTGIYAIHDYSDIIGNAHISININDDHSIITKIVTNDVGIIIEINLHIREIIIVYVKVETPGQGIGFSIFQEMLKNANASSRFKRIRCRALGDFEMLREKNINGYIVWPLFGFTLTSPSTSYFIKLIEKLQLSPQSPSLNHLLHEDEVDYLSIFDNMPSQANGIKFWEQYGFSCNVEFNINRYQRTKNNHYMDLYISKKTPSREKRLRILGRG